MRDFSSLRGRVSNNKFFYFAVLPALLFQVVATYLYLVVFPGEAVGQVIYIINKAVLVLWPILWVFFAGVRGWSFLKGEVRRSLLLGGAFGLLIVLAVVGLYFGFNEFWYQFLPNLREAVDGFGFMDNYLLFAFFLSIVHSFIEEYFWRWFIVNGLMVKFKKWTAAVIGAVFFSVHHFIIISLLLPFHLSLLFSAALFVLAVGWSAIYFRTKSLSGPWLSHFLADAVVMGVGYVMLMT